MANNRIHTGYLQEKADKLARVISELEGNTYFPDDDAMYLREIISLANTIGNEAMKLGKGL